ncbi:MAG UNVERIFIED_CONTAM: hypothetical protein LVT10_26435 [Anaerolineae bacterium]
MCWDAGFARSRAVDLHPAHADGSPQPRNKRVVSPSTVGAIMEGVSRRKVAGVVMASGVIFALVYVGLRVWIGDVPISANHGVLDLLPKNLTRPLPYFLLLLTYGAIPFLAWVYWNEWADRLKRVGMLVLPAWLIVHLLISRIAETRLFLVPFVIVILPGWLYGLQAHSRQLLKEGSS